MQQQENTLQIIPIVQGNLLQLAIPLQREIVSLVNGQVDISYEDFAPTGPVTVVLACGNFANKYRATMDSELTNVAHIEDNGTLPVGVYSITILCRDENAKRMRYKKRAVVNVVDTTAEAGIEPGTEFAVGTQWLSAAVFLAMGSGGGGFGEETDPVFSASPAARITDRDITDWGAKQEAIADLGQIRAGAAAGATALQPGALDGYATSDAVNRAIARIQSAIDELMGADDVTEAINTFREIVAFLDSVENTETLAGIIAGLNTSIAGKVDKVTGKGLSTNDFTTTLLNKLNLIEDGAQVNVINGINKHDGTPLNPDNNGIVTLPEQTEVDMTDYYDKDEVDDRISQMEATIEQQQLTVITGDRLSLWLDEDGESINIMAGEVPDIAAAPTISHVINNDGTATVTIVNNEQGAIIYYTTDGTTPTESSSVYSSQLTINTAGLHTIKAIAIMQDKLKSSVATDTINLVSCQTPNIEFDDTPTKTAIVTATAGNDESVSLTIGNQTTTGIGSATMTINKTTSSQELNAIAIATANGKLSASASESYTISEKVDHVFGAHSLGGKAISSATDIKVTTTGDFQSQLATLTEEDGVIWWEIDLQGHVWLNNNGYMLYNVQAGSTSIFDTDGGANILTIEHIPEEVTEIRDYYVFNTCVNMTLFKTTGNTNLAAINSAFRGLTSLKTVILPNSVTSIPFGAFQNAYELESVSAPSATTIAQGGFANCAKLVSLVLGTLTAIGQEAFYGCEALVFTGIDFSNVASFGNSAFRGCKALTSFTLRNVIKIPNYMFYGCTSLTTLDLPSDLEEIGTQAFMWGCTQLELVLPSTISKIGSSATQFAGITSVTINRAVPPTLDNNGLYGSFLIYVPNENVEDYKTAWSSLESRIKGISEKQ